MGDRTGWRRQERKYMGTSFVGERQLPFPTLLGVDLAGGMTDSPVPIAAWAASPLIAFGGSCPLATKEADNGRRDERAYLTVEGEATRGPGSEHSERRHLCGRGRQRAWVNRCGSRGLAGPIPRGRRKCPAGTAQEWGAPQGRAHLET